MPRCDACGSDDGRSFEVRASSGTFTFDSFECAIHKLAPSCSDCGRRVVGHGVEVSGRTYCCADCASPKVRSGKDDVRSK